MSSDQWAGAAFCALLVACPSTGADGGRPRVTDSTAEDYAAPALPQGHVVLHDAYGGALAVKIEIAATNDSRNRGLMWRSRLDEGSGMLFVFEHDEVHSFWMRNTLIPLDMLFIDKDHTIVGIVENAIPRTLIGRATEKASRYVLEVPGGWTAKAGIKTGGRAEFRLPPTLQIEP